MPLFRRVTEFLQRWLRSRASDVDGWQEPPLIPLTLPPLTWVVLGFRDGTSELLEPSSELAGQLQRLAAQLRAEVDRGPGRPAASLSPAPAGPESPSGAFTTARFLPTSSR